MLELPARPISSIPNNAVLNKEAKFRRGLYVRAQYQCDDFMFPMNMLVDSGASGSLMNISVYEQIPPEYRPKLIKTAPKVRLADNSLQESTGCFTISMKIGSVVQNLQMVV